MMKPVLFAQVSHVFIAHWLHKYEYEYEYEYEY